jgi:hypothetical protein
VLTLRLSILPALLVSSAALAETPTSSGPDLTGLGRFDFPFDAADFSEFASSLVDDTVDITLTIDKRGAVTACDISPTASGAGPRLCQAAQKGRMLVPYWYTATMQGGHIGLHLDAVLARAVPVRPIQFVEGPRGLPVRLAVASGKCTVVDPKMNSVDRDAVCAAFDAAGRPGLRGNQAYQFTDISLLVDAGKQDYNIYTSPLSTDKGKPVEFVSPAETLPRLGAADGKLNAQLSYDRYPRIVNEGTARVLIGFDRTGTAQTCRPVSSTNSSYLANWTCGALISNVRFDFVSGAPRFEGLRYLVVPVRW